MEPDAGLEKTDETSSSPESAEAKSALVVCTHCGAEYEEFQSSCDRCAAPLPRPSKPLAPQPPTVPHSFFERLSGRLLQSIRRVVAYVTCPWCLTTHGDFLQSCKRCGGPMPVPPGMDPGPPPPPPPRPLPDGLARRLRNIHIINALKAFLPILGFYLVFVLPIYYLADSNRGITIFLVTLFFLAFGGGIGFIGFLMRQSQVGLLDALKEGQSVVGEVTAVTHQAELDRDAPWQVSYRFTVGDREYVGACLTSDASCAERKPGHRLHVLYLPHDPSLNTVYPPLADASPSGGRAMSKALKTVIDVHEAAGYKMPKTGPFRRE